MGSYVKDYVHISSKGRSQPCSMFLIRIHISNAVTETKHKFICQYISILVYNIYLLVKISLAEAHNYQGKCGMSDESQNCEASETAVARERLCKHAR
jgi:hypothetical protein